MELEKLSQALNNAFVTFSQDDDGQNITDAMKEVADAITSASRHLGLNNALTPMGALELLSKAVNDGAQNIADGLHAIADAIANAERSEEKKATW